MRRFEASGFLRYAPSGSMPYALVAARDRLFAGLAGGELWESRDRGDTWHRCTLLGEKPSRLLALATPAQDTA